jgi:hypothetical protein
MICTPFTSPSGRRDRRKPYLYWFLVLLLVAILPAIGSDGFVIARANFVFLVVVYPIVVFCQWLIFRVMARRGIRRLVKEVAPNKGQLGRHKLVLNAGDQVESTAVGESRTLWQGVDCVEQDRDYIFIYTQPHGRIPRPERAFNSAETTESFYQLARINQPSSY